MLTERTLHLINLGIDCELSPGEQEELDAILERSAEARAMMAEFQKLATMLEAEPDKVPPPGLSKRILNELTPPQQATFSLSKLFSPFRPATAGLAFAVGLLAAVGVYELGGNTPVMDSEHMVGTMIANPAAVEWIELDTIKVDEAGLSGAFVLRAGEDYLVIDIDLETAGETGIEIGLKEAGLEFGGITLTRSGQEQNKGTYEFSGEVLHVLNQGRGAFSVLLPVVARKEAGGREIRIELSSGGKRVYSGVLRG